MSAPTEVSKTQADPGPESPTTARPLEMDDDDVQETGILGDDAPIKYPTAGSTNAPGVGAAATTAASTTAAAEEVAPAKPPRPMTEQQRNEQTLKEAFPSIDLMVIKAVLRASGNSVEPAFNAILEMTDPDAVQQEQPPPQPPRPTMAPSQPSSTTQSQLEADEQYARQLAQHYESVGSYEARTSNRSGPGSRPQQTGDLGPDGEREHSFMDDDLPVIRDNLRKGFQETQKQVNSWITTLKKRIDEEWNENDDDQDRQHRNQSGGRGGALMDRPSRDGAATRRNRDDDRYDADPELLSDDFAGMKFHNDGSPANRAQRPPTNPNLFKPPPPSVSPKPGPDGRKVAFRDDIDDIDAYGTSPKVPPKDATASAASTPGKASKWQPLSAADPSPVQENDPFSLGDSDDEKDKSAGTAGSGLIKMKDDDDEGERLRAAAAEAMADSLVGDDKKKTETAKKN